MRAAQLARERRIGVHRRGQRSLGRYWRAASGSDGSAKDEDTRAAARSARCSRTEQRDRRRDSATRKNRRQADEAASRLRAGVGPRVATPARYSGD
jgi:hypothetical protein